MDAPFDGVVATQAIRAKGPTEKQLFGYNQQTLLSAINQVFDYIIDEFPQPFVMIQIARGRSSADTLQDIHYILDKLTDSGCKYEIKTGYRSSDYFKIPKDSEQEFVFVNIGMFARLTNVHQMLPGTACNPITTIDLDMNDEQRLIIFNKRNHDDAKNILNHFSSQFQNIILLGMTDQMPFVTPDQYPAIEMQRLIHLVLTS
ncbi:unnamed protein product [Rotaria sp. Silwood2]|nr:unnamed protein product [Rotaria sp. Silwood2]CAF3418648.1 unnamed protein product [Rotaria sp. Silwood2]CAF4323339.1 unnamed protein product [Rotaria sp. Silwood2]CAF4366941.1 unnamed protein product [Rotaria sp. Silwood2]CAF4838944.1 unnamed protein product [Rotaria sp. Silwood2]